VKRATISRLLCGTFVTAAWFVTMAGGWGDIGEALAREFPVAEAADASRVIPGKVLLEGDDLGMPTRLVLHGDEVLLVDRFRDEAIFGVDRRSGEVAWSFGRKGEGPRELKSPKALVVVGQDLAVLDAGLNRISWLGPVADGSYSLLETTQITSESVVTDFSLSADGPFVVSGFLGNQRLGQVSREGAFLGHLGAAPDVDELPPQRRAEVFQGTLRSNRDGRLHVATSRFASHIDVLDDATGELRTIWGPERFAPHAGKYETRFGYLDSAPMSDGFLALYSGRTRDEYPGRANYGAIVDEFDWDGTHRARYELDSDVITIAYDESERTLYAVRHNLVPAILVYELDR
jgi:hypothetical protein